ncbi:methyl-accepting chemotaxis protein [Anaeromicropila herbilytica]|uniref:Methyl-accepting transducer domain-containing protein n=1 Tax=Anaeromicropila herbilytica TaxID=2785025 RepID=A0A7R7EHK5_9FIRM|nr:methyl-accepting chemotaxis protein [Anaeromicropila herbilytica]BCN29365.1 hypothetical protein bsdtb5_06600 [Anaeromicropila herbilytica]
MNQNSYSSSQAMIDQFKRVNKFTTIVLGILAFYILGTIGNTVLYGSKDMKDMIIPILLFIAGIASNTIIYYKNESTLVRYISMITYLVLTSYLLFYGLNTSTYIYLFPALLIMILFFDLKYSLIFSGVIILINIVDIILLLQVKDSAPFTLDSSYAVQIFGIVVCSIISCFISAIAKLNNENILNEVIEEKVKQENLTNEIMHIADRMNDKIGSTDSIIGQINESNDALNHAVKEIAESTQTNAESIMQQKEMTGNIQGIIEGTDYDAGKMKELADKSEVAVKEGLVIIDNLKVEANNLDEANGIVSNTMDALEEKMNEVQKITNVIFGISSQTNMLALNASIEAARAGEQGRSFAVVADQIRQLADETRKSTESIKALIAELNVNSVDAKDAAKNVQSVSTEQNKLVENAQYKFSHINQVVVELASLIMSVNSKINEINRSNNSIVDSLTQLSATSEEVTASSEEAYSLCCHSAEAVKKESELLRELEELAKQFKKYEAN